ncbi:MAG: pentapeptide repeat-containing protein [Leptolyngbya sp. LCM1.Bin17]|nr:MAG: pentapeptide repeat-containing protein [Leptolyngbya sp. LCM1.Bin17]
MTILFFLILFLLILWKVPQQSITADVTDSKERAELLNANRESLLKIIQTIAGLGFIATAYLAWKNLKLAEENFYIIQKNFQVAEDKQVTERFGKAVEMLANEKLEVRVGGIYLLERIAKDSKEDQLIVIETLVAFIREQTTSKQYIEYIESQQSKKPRQDIQSALDVIGRRKTKQDPAPHGVLVSGKPFLSNILDLRETHLEGAFLNHAKLAGANLAKAYLQGSELRHADLRGANLFEAHLEEADLFGAKLQAAFLNLAYLQKANLNFAHLKGVILVAAHLEGAYLNKADLQSASLNNAHLEKTSLKQTILQDSDIRTEYLQEDQLSEAVLCNTKLPDHISLDPNRNCEKNH